MSHRPACASFRFVVPILVAVWCGEAAFGQATYSWTTGTSNPWGSPNWTLNGTPNVGPPGATDNAIIGTGGTYTVSVTDARTINNVTLSGANATLLIGTPAVGPLTVNGAFNLNNGFLDNTAGGLKLNGAFNWGGGDIVGGTVTASNGGTVSVAGSIVGPSSVLRLAGGNWNWTNGNLQLNNGGTLQIDSTASLNVNVNNTSFATNGSGTNTINNAGLLQKTGGGGSSTLPSGVTLNNTGTWRVTSGSWNIQGGVVNNSGVIDIGSNGTVSANGGTLNLNAGSTITGTGKLVMTNAAGHISVNGNVSTAGSVLIQRGVFDGAGSLTVLGSFDLQGFDSNSAVNTTVNALGGGNWTGTSTPFIGAGTVNINGGTVTWGGHAITFKNSGTLTVGANGTLDLTDNSSITVDAGFTATVGVNGLFKKSGGTSNATIGNQVNLSVGSTGTIDVQSGNLIFQTAAVSNNGVIKASTGQVQFGAATAISGFGTLASGPNGTILIAAGAGNTVTQSGGFFTNAGTLNVSSGKFALSDAVTVTNFDAASHTLTGGVWKVGNATLNLGSRTISTIDAGTSVELGSSGSVVSGLSSLTQVNGNLRLFNSATLTPLSTVTVAGTVEASGTFGGNLTATTGGTIAGNGTVNGSVVMQSGSVITPGPGPYAATGTGILKTGNLTLQGGSQYTWEVNSWATNATAGSGFDQLKGTIAGSKLNLNGASTANPILLKITSLNGSSPGQIANYDPTVAHDWVIADYSNGNTSGGIVGFSADKFTLDTSAFANDPNTNRFFIHTDANSNQLILSFTPVPEPVTPLLAGAACVGVVGWLRKRKPV